MLYQIESISHLDGTPRTEESYQKRIGRYGFIFGELEEDMSMIFLYVDSIKSQKYSGGLVTSHVTDFLYSKDGKCVTVTTENSIYVFREVDTVLKPRKKRERIFCTLMNKPTTLLDFVISPPLKTCTQNKCAKCQWGAYEDA